MSALLYLYQTLTRAGKPLLDHTLGKRLKNGKEDGTRIDERRGRPGRPRPAGPLVWIHAASNGEANSTLILMKAIQKTYPAVQVLVTTGTVSSAALMAKRLPPFAIHQFIPLDHPDWVASFLNHWRPDFAFWMESELWPNMVMELGRRNIPLALINARLSEKSFHRWKTAKGMIARMLRHFTVILTQTKNDEDNFRKLGAGMIATTGNLKYSSTPLPCDPGALADLKTAIGTRPCWVYGSCHEGEETLACRIHAKLKQHIPDLVTILVPRHVERRDRVAEICRDAGLSYSLRGPGHALPGQGDDIYIADTIGELGVFYTLAPIAFIGGSFSDGEGGGHNPVEAAQLGCAVLTGPKIQNQQEMFDDMFRHDAAIQIKNEGSLYVTLSNLLGNQARLTALQEKSAAFAKEKSFVIDTVMAHLAPYLRVLETRDAA